MDSTSIIGTFVAYLYLIITELYNSDQQEYSAFTNSTVNLTDLNTSDTSSFPEVQFESIIHSTR